MEPLKNMYDTAALQGIADIAAASVQPFDRQVFLQGVFAQGWEELELKQRMRRIATVLNSMLSGNYKNDIEQVLKFTNAVIKAQPANTFIYMFIPDMVEQYGQAHPAISLQAMERITQLISCEFAIRPYLISDLQGTLQQMLAWAEHPHASVRRLASEGCRPRLPWGMALPALKKDPSPILPILERLKDDPSEFVRRSVANNLNDITKDNPQVALDIARRWMGHSTHTDKIVKHGCRTLLKRGDTAALGLFGLAHEPECSVTGLQLLKKRISIGDHLHFSFSLVNEGTATVPLRVEYAITYAKANNKQGRKVFKITENTYVPGAVVSFSRKQSFADMTTRKHYAGKHTIEILVNGKRKASAELVVMG
ncbi:DNA alkylation repair protein [Nemorincola caseinilytica]|uniref:DNA alkylation repair protein n=1 Tax=Nemorincola caseinilytica TaxID=2054315 RepID=A0ABP8NKP0_9BACT